MSYGNKSGLEARIRTVTARVFLIALALAIAAHLLGSELVAEYLGDVAFMMLVLCVLSSAIERLMRTTTLFGVRLWHRWRRKETNVEGAS